MARPLQEMGARRSSSAAGGLADKEVLETHVELATRPPVRGSTAAPAT
ncbi:hypothetical protein JOE40_003437 [Arthrobacter sp. PvP102]|nr:MULTISPECIES: hypothetical protein [unclassified Arthrobacter]MBP1233794.1 hypothetical protein [Arthrobacter sp. PvP103]MBP1238928.1 hypothetical protein [Arthrobacter sp. PvP102]